MDEQGPQLPDAEIPLHRGLQRDVILNLWTMFDMNEIRIPNNLAYTDQLFRELNAMRAETIGRTGNVRYGARSGEHDDLVTALLLAMWQSRPRVPTVGEKANGSFSRKMNDPARH